MPGRGLALGAIHELTSHHRIPVRVAGSPQGLPAGALGDARCFRIARFRPTISTMSDQEPEQCAVTAVRVRRAPISANSNLPPVETRPEPEIQLPRLTTGANIV